jgi:membrane fusion protein (multidrug efflux system)
VAFESSEVRPQVSGIVRARTFQEGALVRAGQVLYVIDPATYRAAVDQAAAGVASAQATVGSTQLQAQRYAELVKINAVSRQEADNAQAAYRQAVANVAQARAALQASRINLQYTQVRAPITGRIGRSTVTQGALVTGSQATALATIQRLDPVYVDIAQSSADLLRLRRQLSGGGAQPTRTPVRLMLEDGTEYGQSGVLQFTEPVVDPATGSVTLRAEFPNPAGVLIPGMFVRAVVTQAVDPNAILAPQQGVSRNEQGQPTALVVGPGNRVEQRILTTGQTLGDRWIVRSGLNPGDRLIVEGLQRAKPGAVVRPVPAGSPSRQPAPAAPGAAKR